MKIVEYNPQKGFLKIVIEVPEDLYYFSLILEKNDIVYSWTTRQLRIERTTESIRGKRIKVYLGIKVTNLEFHKFLKSLRIRGIVIDAPENLHIKGAYHTLSINIGSEVTVYKEKFSVFVNRIIKMASVHYKKIILICVGDDNIAIGYLTPQGIDIKISQDIYIPKKEGKKYSLLEFYRNVLLKFFEEKKDLINLKEFNEVIIASTSLLLPLLKEIFNEKELLKNKVIKYIQVFEGGRAGIYEILRREDLKQLFKNTRYLYEKEKVDELFRYLMKGDSRVAIGFEEVSKAAELHAIKYLIINDAFFFDIEEKNKIREILDKTIESSGEIIIVSFESEQGKKLEKMGNIAALLYFRAVS